MQELLIPSKTSMLSWQNIDRLGILEGMSREKLLQIIEGIVNVSDFVFFFLSFLLLLKFLLEIFLVERISEELESNLGFFISLDVETF